MYDIDCTYIPTSKRILAYLYSRLGLAYMERIYNRLGSQHILAVNYHSTPSKTIGSFERQLQWLSRNYTNVGKVELDLFLAGKWQPAKPGIMVHFDDGLLDNAEVAAPLLEKYGITGWFQIVTDLLDNPATAPYETLSWDQAFDLVQLGHIVCAHSATHKWLTNHLSDAEIEHEVVRPYNAIKSRLGTAPFAFCYPGGETGSYDVRAVRLVKQYYQNAFTTYFGLIKHDTSPYALTRCHVESGWEPADVILSTSHWWMLKHRSTKKEYLANLMDT